jgi:hypothetical protein
MYFEGWLQGMVIKGNAGESHEQAGRLGFFALTITCYAYDPYGE